MNKYNYLARFSGFALLVSLIVPGTAHGQDELRPVTKTYAITNATILQAPDRKIEHGTLVIKDGLITAVGAAVMPPADAIIVKGDSMFIYAGFIDGLSRIGVSRPKEEGTRERPKDPGNPTLERAGVTPQLDVIDYLSASEKSIEEMRSAGFTVSQVVPYGNMLPGGSAVILLGTGTVPRMVLAGNASLYSELSPVQGAFPSTVIGVLAKWKELYTQASNSLSYEGLYAANKNGIARPATSKVLQAFYPVIEKKKTVLFKTENVLDVHRVMALQAALGFKLVLGNLKEGWTLTDKLKAAGTSVFLSLELPEDKKDEEKKNEDKSKKEDDTEKRSGVKPDQKKETKKDSSKVKTPTDLEKDALEKRRAEFVAKYISQAGVFSKAGIHFGFSTLTVKSKDVASNLRKMIAAGLPENEALASLTTYPAQLLGMSDRLGSIENGKIANLVITDKSYFNEKGNIRYVFVDGEMHKLDIKESKKKKSVSTLDISGSWTLTTETPQGKNDIKVIFKKDQDSFTATVSGGMLTQAVDAKDVELTDDHLKFSFTLNMQGNKFDVLVEGKIDGDAFKGTSTAGQFGNFATTGSKDPK